MQTPIRLVVVTLFVATAGCLETYRSNGVITDHSYVGPAAMETCLTDPAMVERYRTQSRIINAVLVAGVRDSSAEVTCYFGPAISSHYDCFVAKNTICTYLMWNDERLFIPVDSERGLQLLATMHPQLANSLRAWETRFGTARNAVPNNQPDIPGGPQRGRAAGAPVAGSDR